jgi:hypothetical protein
LGHLAHHGLSSLRGIGVHLHPHGIAIDFTQIDGNGERELPTIRMYRDLSETNTRPVLCEPP